MKKKKFISRLSRKFRSGPGSAMGLLILAIALIGLDLGAFASLYLQTLSDNLLQDIFLLTAACSLTIPLCILLASQLKTYRSSQGKISSMNKNGWKDPVLEKLLPSAMAMPEK